MAKRPTTLPLFCTANPSNMADLPQSLVETGYMASEPVPVQFFNKQANLVGAWLQWLDQSAVSTALFTDSALSARLVSQATWRWTLSTTTLAWSDAVFISYPGATDAANTIPAGSVQIPAGSVAFVQTNAPFATVGSTTSGSSVLTSALYGDQVQLGWSVSGAGIPAGALVTAISADGASITISKAATATASGVSLSFAGSGALTVRVSPAATLSPSANTVVLARAMETTVYVGINTGQMKMHDGEARRLLEAGYLDVRRAPAGQALAARQFVSIAGGTANDGRTVGSAYLAEVASSVDGFRANVIGAVTSACAAGETAKIAVGGYMEGFSGLLPGAPYYLRPGTPGGITAVRPVSAGQQIVPLGVAVSATALLLNPSAAAGATTVPVVTDRQQVSMGRLLLPANTAYPAASAPAFQVNYSAPSAATNANGFRIWVPEAAGSVLALKLWSNRQLTGPLTIQLFAYVQNAARPDLPIISQSFGSSLAQPISGNFVGAFSYARGTYQFDGPGLLYARVVMPTAIAGDTLMSLDMTVDMGAT